MLEVYYERKSSKKTKKGICKQRFKKLYTLLLTFGCEIWIITQRQKSRLQAAEMKYLRRIRSMKKKIRLRQIQKDSNCKQVLQFIEEEQGLGDKNLKIKEKEKFLEINGQGIGRNSEEKKNMRKVLQE